MQIKANIQNWKREKSQYFEKSQRELNAISIGNGSIFTTNRSFYRLNALDLENEMEKKNTGREIKRMNQT